MVTSAEVRAEFNVTEQTLGRWRKRGLPCHRVGTKSYRYDLEEIRAWMDANRVPSLTLETLVGLNRTIAAMEEIPLTVRGCHSTLQQWLPEEILRLAESPVSEDTEQTMRDMVGFVRVLQSMQ